MGQSVPRRHAESFPHTHSAHIRYQDPGEQVHEREEGVGGETGGTAGACARPLQHKQLGTNEGMTPADHAA